MSIVVEEELPAQTSRWLTLFGKDKLPPSLSQESTILNSKSILVAKDKLPPSLSQESTILNSKSILVASSPTPPISHNSKLFNISSLIPSHLSSLSDPLDFLITNSNSNSNSNDLPPELAAITPSPKKTSSFRRSKTDRSSKKLLPQQSQPALSASGINLRDWIKDVQDKADDEANKNVKHQKKRQKKLEKQQKQRFKDVFDQDLSQSSSDNEGSPNSNSNSPPLPTLDFDYRPPSARAFRPNPNLDTTSKWLQTRASVDPSLDEAKLILNAFSKVETEAEKVRVTKLGKHGAEEFIQKIQKQRDVDDFNASDIENRKPKPKPKPKSESKSTQNKTDNAIATQNKIDNAKASKEMRKAQEIAVTIAIQVSECTTNTHII